MKGDRITDASRPLQLLVGDARAAMSRRCASRGNGRAASVVGIASTASEHLTALAQTGLVARERRGRSMLHQLNDDGERFLALLASAARAKVEG